MDRERVVGDLLTQAGWCNQLGSPMYASILERCAEDARAGGPVWQVMGSREIAVQDFADPLRLLGSVHRLVLEGRAPELARFYGSAGGAADAADPWPAFRDVLVRHHGAVLEGMTRPVQTNEVGRCAALLGGFLLVARETGLPLALAEIGASAGLNLRWDRYRYDVRGRTFGDPASPVRFEEPFVEDGPSLDAGVEVVERRGCDLRPVDPTTEEGALTLLSYVWPDQAHRVERLRGALEVARRVPASVEESDGVEWLERRLAEPHPGVATVVFHSVVEMYLPADRRARLYEVVREAGLRATPDAPLAWLKLEHIAGTQPEPSGPAGVGPRNVHLAMWPGGEQRAIATSSPHGPPIWWHGEPESN